MSIFVVYPQTGSRACRAEPVDAHTGEHVVIAPDIRRAVEPVAEFFEKPGEEGHGPVKEGVTQGTGASYLEDAASGGVVSNHDSHARPERSEVV